MRSKTVKTLLLFLLPVLLLVCNSKSVAITGEDKAFIKVFAKEWNLDNPADSIHKNFITEVEFIRAAQKAIVSNVAHTEIEHVHFGDVSYYYKERNGLCYDRAVLMEKFFSEYGFDFRHVYLYFSENNEKPSLISIFKKGLSSHALLEVKTKEGWMAVGTNADWIGLTNDNKILSVSTLRDKLQAGNLNLKEDATHGQVFWKSKKQNYRYIYGLYSRHGNFFASSPNTMSFFSFVPDYNLRMLLYNF